MTSSKSKWVIVTLKVALVVIPVIISSMNDHGKN